MRSKSRTVIVALVAVFAFSAVAAAPAFASGAPTVETTQGTRTGETATLHGLVNPNGAETKYHFEYGTEKGKYTSSTGEASAGSGTSNVEEKATIGSGLKVGTIYYFRIVAKNSNGGVDGSNEVVGVTFRPVPTKNKFTSTSGAVLMESGNRTIECAKSTTMGEIISATALGKIVMKMTGCTSSGPAGSGCPIQSGTVAGEIVTESLKGELGTVKAKEAASEVGLLLTPENTYEVLFIAEGGCFTGGAFQGALGGEVTPTKKKQTTSKLVIQPQIKEIALDSGKTVKTDLEAGASRWTFSQTDETTFEEALEIT